MKIKELKKGDFFTRKEVSEPSGREVYIRGAYDPASKKYECQNFDDANRFIYLKGDAEVFTDFVF